MSHFHWVLTQLVSAVPVLVLCPQYSNIEDIIRSSADYVIVCGFNRVDEDLIDPGIQSSTIFDNRFLTFESTADTEPEQVQQILIGLIPSGNGTTSNDLPFSAGVTAVLAQPNPAGTTPEEIEFVINEALDARRVTRQNMNALGVLAPINDDDPT